MTILFLLIVIVILLSMRQTSRDYSFSLALLIAALTWLSIRIHVLRALSDLCALALEHWLEIAMALCAVVILIVPLLMLYVGLHDQPHRTNRHAKT